MKLETIKKDKKKKIIIGGMIVLSVIAGTTLTTTRAKYKSVQSLKLASGIVNYKASDLHIVAIKTSEDGTNYNERAEIPTSGYSLNTSLSKCRIPESSLTGENAPVDESIPIEYKDGKVYIGITKKNTKCYLYFDKSPTAEDTLSKLNITNINTGTPTFTITATGTLDNNNGIFKVSDGMYGEYSYYWRGQAPTNHVIFDSKCWRIIRINGDGSIRLIYNGDIESVNTCPGNNSVVLFRTAYNELSDNSSYVGWSYIKDMQRPNNKNPQIEGTRATLRVQLEDTWYASNISENAKAKIATGKFCNDRSTKSNETWRRRGDTQYYAAYARLIDDKIPELSCPSGDVYDLTVGMITADEVTFAGASGTTNNTSFYLYDGQSYWTMTSAYWFRNNSRVRVFYVTSDGTLDSSNWVSTSSPSARPVINLRSDVTFNAGSDGTKNNPYIVQ